MQPTRPFTELLKDGPDPIAFFCHLLADESAPTEVRKEAARMLRPYYHPLLAQAGPYLERFLGREK